jgi:hypothetical protein
VSQTFTSPSFGVNKIFLIVGVVGLSVMALGVGGLAFAQSGSPHLVPSLGYGPGTMGGWGGHGGGWASSVERPHSYYATMLKTFAKMLGIGVDEIQARLESDESMRQIAESEGFSVEEVGEMMRQARVSKIEQAFEDGTLIPEQLYAKGYRWQAEGFGPGYGDCLGYGVEEGFHRGSHGRWNSP